MVLLALLVSPLTVSPFTNQAVRVERANHSAAARSEPALDSSKVLRQTAGGEESPALQASLGPPATMLPLQEPCVSPCYGQTLTPADSPPCVFVAHLHVRKCAGTSVRNLFQNLEGWNQSGYYCDSMASHADREYNLKGRHWSETHCDEDVGHFLEGLRTLRAKLEPTGCKVVSSLLLRDPVDQISSEWLYFNGEPGKADTHTAFEWSKRVPENMLRWLLKYQDSQWRDERPPVDINIADCDATIEFLDRKFDQIDLVGSMDTPEQCACTRCSNLINEVDNCYSHCYSHCSSVRTVAQWWVALGDMAGFDSSPKKDNEAPTEGDSPLAAAAIITEEQRPEMVANNTCSMRARDNALGRLQDAVAARRGDPAVNLAGGASPPSNFDARVDALVARWGGVIPYLDVPSPRHDEMFSVMPFSPSRK